MFIFCWNNKNASLEGRSVKSLGGYILFILLSVKDGKSTF